MSSNQIIAWKGKTFSQISSIIKLNQIPTTTTSTKLYFKALPLAIYRREIATNITNDTARSNSRISIKIDELNQPNGTTQYRNTNLACGGIANVVDPTLPNNKGEQPGSLASCQITKNTTGAHMFSSSQNALRRVRSSGMIQNKFNTNTNKPVYCYDSKQYLISRSKTVGQSSFNYLSTGNATAEPGSSGALKNTYVGNGTVGTCNKRVPVYYKPNNSKFSQQGGVSASAALLRRKYNTINSIAVNSLGFANLGASTANAMAYGAPNDAYTIKTKIGYQKVDCLPCKTAPNTQTNIA